MDQPPGNDQDEPARQADKQASVMKDQLRKEVAAWNATRSETSARQEAEFSAPATPRPSPHPAAKQVKRSNLLKRLRQSPRAVPKNRSACRTTA